MVNCNPHHPRDQNSKIQEQKVSQQTDNINFELHSTPGKMIQPLHLKRSWFKPFGSVHPTHFQGD